MRMMFWSTISLGGTLAAGMLATVAAFLLDLDFGLVVLADLLAITVAANAYKVYRFKPRPDNQDGVRPPRPFDPRQFWRFARPRDAVAYFLYVDAGSMPSIHSARAFNQALLFGVFLGRPDWATDLLLLAALVAYSRVVKKRHFIADAVAGLVVGLLTAAVSLPFL